MVLQSPWRSLAPYPAEPGWAHLATTAQRLPDKRALIEGSGRASTFAELWQASRAVARFLQREAGVTRGDRVAMSVDGSREFVAAMYGTFLAGAAVVPVSPLFQEQELEAQLADCQASILLASTFTRHTAASLAPDPALPVLRSMYPLEDLWELAGDDRVPEPVELDFENDVAIMPYSGGTEGPPKGVMLTHANAIASMSQRKATGGLNEDSIVLALLPMWASVRSVFALGATCVQRDSPEADRVLAIVEKYRVTQIIGRPFAIHPLVQAAERGSWDLTSVRSVETSGTPLPTLLAQEASQRFGCPVRQAYHLMETFGSANRPRPGDSNPASVGYPVPDTEERIVDLATGEDLPVGEDGELLIRGPQVMKGYWRRPEATVAAFLADGWLRTGDVVRQDEAGRITIVDRAKDMMKVYGRQVAPAEIESILLDHPAVKEAAVVPVFSEEAGELPKAFVVLNEGQQASGAELALSVVVRLAPYKALHAVEFVRALPKGPGGKVLRRDLAQRA